MSTVHVYTTTAQPATKYVDRNLGRPITFRNDPRRQLRCHVCDRLRWAKNLTVRVYYDCNHYFCIEGTSSCLSHNPKKTRTSSTSKR